MILDYFYARKLPVASINTNKVVLEYRITDPNKRNDKDSYHIFCVLLNNKVMHGVYWITEVR